MPPTEKARARIIDPEEQLLAQQIKNQDKKSFETLVVRFSRRMYRQAFLILESPGDAEDAIQEVFVKAYLGMSQYKGGSLFAWLATINHHHCIDLLRKSKRELPEVKNPTENLFSTIPQKETDTIGEILVKLSENEREVVHLRVIENLEYAEIAEVTGLAEGSLRNILSKSLRKLREQGEKS